METKTSNAFCCYVCDSLKRVSAKNASKMNLKAQKLDIIQLNAMEKSPVCSIFPLNSGVHFRFTYSKRSFSLVRTFDFISNCLHLFSPFHEYWISCRLIFQDVMHCSDYFFFVVNHFTLFQSKVFIWKWKDIRMRCDAKQNWLKGLMRWIKYHIGCCHCWLVPVNQQINFNFAMRSENQTECFLTVFFSLFFLIKSRKYKWSSSHFIYTAIYSWYRYTQWTIWLLNQ